MVFPIYEFKLSKDISVKMVATTLTIQVDRKFRSTLQLQVPILIMENEDPYIAIPPEYEKSFYENKIFRASVGNCHINVRYVHKSPDLMTITINKGRKIYYFLVSTDENSDSGIKIHPPEPLPPEPLLPESLNIDPQRANELLDRLTGPITK